MTYVSSGERVYKGSAPVYFIQATTVRELSGALKLETHNQISEELKSTLLSYHPQPVQ